MLLHQTVKLTSGKAGLFAGFWYVSFGSAIGENNSIIWERPKSNFQIFLYAIIGD